MTDNRVHLLLNKADKKRLDTLVKATGMSASDAIRACLRQSAGVVRKKYLADFLKKVEDMRDPFDNDSHYNDHSIVAAIGIDDADRQIADIPAMPVHSPEQRTQLLINADKRIERMLWLIDSPNHEIPSDWLADVIYWRAHYEQALALRRATDARQSTPDTPPRG